MLCPIQNNRKQHLFSSLECLLWILEHTYEDLSIMVCRHIKTRWWWCSCNSSMIIKACTYWCNMQCIYWSKVLWEWIGFRCSCSARDEYYEWFPTSEHFEATPSSRWLDIIFRFASVPLHAILPSIMQQYMSWWPWRTKRTLTSFIRIS